MWKLSDMNSALQSHDTTIINSKKITTAKTVI